MGREEADDEPSSVRKREEMAGMDGDIVFTNEQCGQFLVVHESRDPEDGVPACLNLETADESAFGQQLVQRGEICAAARTDLLLNQIAPSEPGRKGVLDGGVHGEIGVGDDLQTVESRLHFPVRPEGSDPGGFHLRQSADLAEAAQDKGQGRMIASGKALRLLAVQGKVEEDLVDDEGKAVLGADLFELRPLNSRGEMPRRVVGMDERNGASAGRDLLPEPCQVDVPAMVVKELVRDKADVAYLSKEVEKGVAGLGDENFVVGIAEEAEEGAVGFTGAGGEEEMLRRERRGVSGVVVTNSLTGMKHAAWIGLVIEDSRDR